jgi:hypothetical protein
MSTKTTKSNKQKTEKKAKTPLNHVNPYQKRVIVSLKRRAKELGFDVVPLAN